MLLTFLLRSLSVTLLLSTASFFLSVLLYTPFYSLDCLFFLLFQFLTFILLCFLP